jgi:fatty-acyl-CoA synthase
METMFIGDWMARGERYWPEALAVVDVAKGAAGRFTYRQLNRRANRLAHWLRDTAGLGPGDRVGVLALNGVEYLDALFACGKLGAILTPFNWRSHWRELVGLIRQTTPRVLLFSAEFAEAVSRLRPECPSLAYALHLDGDGTTASLDYATLLAGQTDEPLGRAEVDAEDIVCLLFTGGTSGTPKAAEISYRMIAWNTLNTIIHELARGDVTITHTPMFHTGGLLVYTLPLLTLGGTVVIMRKWTADDMLALIAAERVTMFFCVPTQYQLMLQSPRFAVASFQNVRFLTSGGAPLPLPVIEAYRQQHGVVFKQGFGMTEFGPGVFSMGPEQAERKAGSIGQPNYFVAAQVVDEAGRPLPAHAIGELVLKGPSMASGYFDNPAASREAVDAAGWFHTGDLARVDDDGFFYIVDRKKDMFISGGENVYPVEIEQALYEHAAVAQCAVVGLPDTQWGEAGTAVVVARPGRPVTESKLLEHCRGRLAHYKVPRAVVFRAELPVSAAGKILKRVLKAELSREREQPKGELR